MLGQGDNDGNNGQEEGEEIPLSKFYSFLNQIYKLKFLFFIIDRSAATTMLVNQNNAILDADTNRQILLLLMRLQQDTNNVITRLSYLEATVMSIQVSY